MHDGWDFDGAERREAHPSIDAALNANEALTYRAPVPVQMLYEHEAMVDEMLARLNKGPKIVRVGATVGTTVGATVDTSTTVGTPIVRKFANLNIIVN